MTDNNDERPEGDKCGDDDCFVCRPRTDVELEGEGTLELKGTGKISAVVSLAGFGHLGNLEGTGKISAVAAVAGYGKLSDGGSSD